MNRCKECGIEIDDYQAKEFNQVCSECTRIIKVSERDKLMEELLSNRNMFEASLILLAIACFFIGVLLSLLFHPLLIILSIMGGIIYAIALLHSRKTRKIKEKLRELRVSTEI